MTQYEICNVCYVKQYKWKCEKEHIIEIEIVWLLSLLLEGELKKNKDRTSINSFDSSVKAFSKRTSMPWTTRKSQCEQAPPCQKSKTYDLKELF